MRKILLITLLLTLAACQNQPQIRFVKEEMIEKEKLIKIDDSELLSILKKKANETHIDKSIENSVVFARCKIDGTNCISLQLYQDKKHNKLKELSLTEYLLMIDYDDFFKLEYSTTEFLMIEHHYTSEGDRISLLKNNKEHVRSIVLPKEDEEMVFVANNVIYLKSI